MSMQTLPKPQEMYDALLRRDSGYDGIFVVAVRTTGIFCRPTCAAKKPQARNVEYFATTREALLAGYRPCKRCRPLDNGGCPPVWVDRLLQRVDRAPTARVSDTDLRAMSIDPARARRYFKQHYGMTFHAYHRARRLGLALSEVRRGRDLNGVGYRHGFDSTSGFRYAFARVFGQPPGRSRDLPCRSARWLDTPLGAMVAVAGPEGLSLLEFVDRRGLEAQISSLRKRLGCAIVPGPAEPLDAIADELSRYFAGSLTRFTVPLEMPGTPFQVSVSPRTSGAGAPSGPWAAPTVTTAWPSWSPATAWCGPTGHYAATAAGCGARSGCSITRRKLRDSYRFLASRNWSRRRARRNGP
jgi:AraC family transcriptional regulator of adaptative response/methylated-DNA-[protein]-cysteine methyltransferase